MFLPINQLKIAWIVVGGSRSPNGPALLNQFYHMHVLSATEYAIQMLH